MAKMQPMPTDRPVTLEDALAAINQLHTCTEERGKDVRRAQQSVAATRKELSAFRREATDRDDVRKGELSTLREDVASIKGALGVMTQSFGLPSPAQVAASGVPEKVRKPTARLDWQAVWSLVGATGGLVLIFKIIDAAWPAIHKAILTVH